MFKAPKVIAEIGCNHKGDISTAFEMIKIAATYCNADVAKFQKRDIATLIPAERYYAPHPHPENAYGSNYGEHRERLEFSVDQHKQLQECCVSHNIEYSTSVWDEVSARQIIALNPRMIKVPSAMNTNQRLLSILADDYGGEIHVSLGMTFRKEEDEMVAHMEKKGRAKDIVLYACTSGYPVDFDEICLLELSRLREKFGAVVKTIGFSGHHLGIAVDVAAMTLGAEWIERHFTLNRTWKGTDHAASLEPDGMRRLCRDLRSVSKALTAKASELLDVEKEQRAKLKWEHG